METQKKSTITVEANVNAPVEKVWYLWTSPGHITKWNRASEDWHTPWAENDLRKGGTFTSRMEARDGSAGFDFNGIYDEVKEHRSIGYTMDDGRQVQVHFTENGNTTRVTETFDSEDSNPRKMQQDGWQAILNNFKTYTEHTPDSRYLKLHSSIEINAPKEKVWAVMLEDETFRKWTSAFTEGSHYEGSWDEGSKIYFLDPEKKGMVSVIAENRPHEYISIKHIGLVHKGEEDTNSQEAKKWAPAFENYSFSEKEGKTIVFVDMDIEEEHKEMFQEMWPKALDKLKELSEKSTQH